MKTISRSYDSCAQARAAVEAIEKAGIPSSDVSLIANKNVSAEYETAEAVSDTAAGAGIGGVVGGGVGLLAGLGLLAIPGLGPVVAAGWLAAMAVGTAAGVATGGLMGSLIGAPASTRKKRRLSPNPSAGAAHSSRSASPTARWAASKACCPSIARRTSQPARPGGATRAGRRSTPPRRTTSPTRPRSNACAETGATREWANRPDARSSC